MSVRGIEQNQTVELGLTTCWRSRVSAVALVALAGFNLPLCGLSHIFPQRPSDVITLFKLSFAVSPNEAFVSARIDSFALRGSPLSSDWFDLLC